MTDLPPISARSHCGQILSWLNKNRGKFYRVSFFVQENSPCFIGYKAGSRIGELEKKGYIQKRISAKVGARGQRFTEYAIKKDAEANILSKKEKPKKHVFGFLFGKK